MADSWSDYFDELFDVDTSLDYKEVLFGAEYQVDHHAQDLFMEAFFGDNKDEAYNELVDYMRTVYDIDFEDAFTWEDFREWYDNQ